MTQLTPEQIQQAREIAQPIVSYYETRELPLDNDDSAILAHAVLALTEQQPEPVGFVEIAEVVEHVLSLDGEAMSHTSDMTIEDIARRLLDKFEVTRKAGA